MPATRKVKYYNTYVLKKINRPGTVGGANSSSYNWYIEESRIRGGYNNVQTGLSSRAFIASETNTEQNLSNSIIYSGVLNSRTGINQTNVFSVGEDITRSVDPSKGSIQKLYAEDTNLTIFQERKVNRALIDKDAIYSAEGVPLQTTSNVVIGAIQSYAGEFGISTNPESFAVYGYQKYFTDASKGSVLRLSRDGLTEISNYGMQDFFRDKLAALGNGKAVGGYDIHNKCYVLSLQPEASNSYQTLSFDEATNGWTSFYSYNPLQMFSILNGFFSTKNGAIYRHYSLFDTTGNEIPRNQFYGLNYSSSVKFVINPDPTRVKTFQTINYEGTNGWEVTSLVSDATGADLFNGAWVSTIDQATVPITNPTTPNTYTRIWSYDEGLYIEGEIPHRAGFNRKQNRYVAAIKNNSTVPLAGQVLIGPDNTGIKAYYATVTMKTDATTDPGGLKELFAVGATYGR